MRNEKENLDIEFKLKQVYTTLVRYAGASDNMRDSFLAGHLKDKYPCSEWRFGGRFGFGGKYRIERNAIDYYPEDHTPELDKLKDSINEMLKEL
jgi:hypothetical protein